MPPINFSGLASGIDTRAMIDAILNFERQPIRQLETRRQIFSERGAALGELRSKLNAFETALRDLAADRTFRGRTATVTDESVLRATAGAGAELGLFQIEVTNLAAAHKVKSTGFTASDQGLVGDGTITIQSGSNDPITIDVSATTGNNSLEAIRDQINAADAGVAASIIFDGAEYRLTVRSEETGTANTLALTDSTDLGLADPANEVTTAADAQLTVDGIAVTSSSNKVSNVIPGITLDLLSVSTGPVSVEVAFDADAVVEAVQGLVSDYNELIGFFNEQFDRDNPGPLASDPTARSVQSQILRLFTGGVDGIPFGQIRSLSAVGVSFDGKTGEAKLDTAELRELLETNFDEVGNLFLSSGRSSDLRVRFLGTTSATVPGTYAVEITQAAEQATLVGSSPITTLNKDETLTITVGSDSVDVFLAKNSDITAVVDAVNQALSGAGIGAAASEDGGALRITSDGFGSTVQLTVVSDRAGQPGGKSSGFGTTPVTDFGADLAGKIGGVDAVANGNILTGAEGYDFEGLSVQVTATAASVAQTGGDFGTVSFSRGLMDSLLARVDQFTKIGDGPLELADESLDNQIEQINLTIERLEAKLSKREATLIQAFGAAERAISLLQSQQSTLSSFRVG